MAKYRYKRIGKKGQQVDEHRTIMEQYLGRPLATGEIVHHINNDPLDNRLENLELTRQSNHAKCHIYTSPIYGKGEDNKQAKLSKDDIPWIRLWLRKGFKDWRLGTVFGVNQATIRDIRNGKTWVGV